MLFAGWRIYRIAMSGRTFFMYQGQAANRLVGSDTRFCFSLYLGNRSIDMWTCKCMDL